VSTPTLDHIAIAAARLGDAPPFLVGILGGTPAYGASSNAFTFGQWRFAGGGRIEILEPRGDDGFLHRHLAQRGPGIHHVTVKVPSLRETCDRAEAHGYKIVGYDDRDPRWMEAFLHPKQALGIVVQMAESRAKDPSLKAWQPPPGPADAPPAVRLVRLRTRARSRERANVQWVDVLGGAVAESSDARVVYRWPGAPLGITVEVDPAAEEGPVAIEFASERDVPLPVPPDPRLGAVFARVR
jgi:methylmalonyl-CoA/ethylmalonyl-CoA epimerase